MTALIVTNPATQEAGGIVSVICTGGGDYKNRILLDSVVVATVCHDTDFDTPITVGLVAGTSTVDWQQLIAGTWTSVDTVTVTVTSSGTGSLVAFHTSDSGSRLAQLCQDTSIRYIEMDAGTYPGFNSYIGFADRGSSHPLTIRPAPGAAVVFNGGGSDTGIFYFGSFIGQPRGKVSYITVDATGTGGSFSATNYNLGDTGLVNTGWASHIAVNGFTASGCDGNPSGTSSHFVYVSTDGAHRADNVTFNGWTVTGDGSRHLNGLQTFAHDVPFGCDGVTAHTWTVTLLNRWCYLWSDSTLIDIDGWNGTNCNHTIDAQQSSSGTVKNCNGHGSCGALAVGSDQWQNTAITNGGGNSA